MAKTINPEDRQRILDTATEAVDGSWDSQNDLRTELRAAKGIEEDYSDTATHDDVFNDEEVESLVGLAIDASRGPRKKRVIAATKFWEAFRAFMTKYTDWDGQVV